MNRATGPPLLACFVGWESTYSRSGERTRSRVASAGDGMWRRPGDDDYAAHDRHVGCDYGYPAAASARSRESVRADGLVGRRLGVPEGLADVPVVGGEQYQVVSWISLKPLLSDRPPPMRAVPTPVPISTRLAGRVRVMRSDCSRFLWELRPSPTALLEELTEEHHAAVIEVLNLSGSCRN